MACASQHARRPLRRRRRFPCKRTRTGAVRRLQPTAPRSRRILQSPRNEGSDRGLLLAAGRARRQLLTLWIKEVSCAHGAQCQHPQHSQVHDLLASDRSIGHAREVAGEEAREWGGGAGPGVLKNESFVLELDKGDLIGVGGRLQGLPIRSSVKSLTLPTTARPRKSCTRARPVHRTVPDLGALA